MQFHCTRSINFPEDSETQINSHSNTCASLFSNNANYPILINTPETLLAKPCNARELCKSLRQWKSRMHTNIPRVIGFNCTLSSQFVSLRHFKNPLSPAAYLELSPISARTPESLCESRRLKVSSLALFPFMHGQRKQWRVNHPKSTRQKNKFTPRRVSVPTTSSRES